MHNPVVHTKHIYKYLIQAGPCSFGAWGSWPDDEGNENS